MRTGTPDAATARLGETSVPASPPTASGVAVEAADADAPAAASAKRGRRRRERVRSRRVVRVVRRVELWSVLKIAAVFHLCLYLLLVVAGVLLWSLATSTGTLDNIQSFVQELFALDSFELRGDEVLRASLLLGAVLVVAGTGTWIVLATLFNLIADLVGGLRVTVVEEERVVAVDDAG